MTRGFQVVKDYVNDSINLPKPATKKAAGYDFESAESITIQPVWGHIFQVMISKLAINADPHRFEKLLKPTLVPTGVKSYMGDDEGLFLYNRSSNPGKKFLVLANGVGVVDADYYENPDNDGHVMFAFINFGVFPVTIKKGDRIGQGVFQPILRADGDDATGERSGGFGSTGE